MKTLAKPEGYLRVFEYSVFTAIIDIVTALGFLKASWEK